MKKFLGFITGRMFPVLLIIAIQLAWIIITLTMLADSFQIISVISTVLSFLIALFIINKYDNPSYKIAWLLFVLLFPFLGAMFYIFLANKRPMRGMRKRINAQAAITDPLRVQDMNVFYQLEKRDPHAGGLSRYIRNTTSNPVYSDSDSKYYSSGEACFEDMIAELKNAKKFVFIEFFIISEGVMWQTVLSILKDKIKEGVDVRLIYDDFGSIKHIPRNYYKKLNEIGIKTICFNRFYPLFSVIQNNRDHRKYFIIDGHTAFTGGINLADEYINAIAPFGYWKDGCVRIRGEAVWSMTLTFITMWNGNTENKITNIKDHRPTESKNIFDGGGYIQPYHDSPMDDEPVGENVYLNIIQSALDYVYIFTPYLIIDHDCIESLRNAAKRGVDVRIVLPGIPDKKIVYAVTKSYFQDLLEAGVKLYLYKPGFVHSKCFVSDDRIATVGSINMDFRSLYLHFENGVLLMNTMTVQDVKKDFLETVQISEAVDKDFRNGFWWGLVSSVFRIIAPMM